MKRLIHFFDIETAVTTVKGAVGVGATTGGFYISILPKVEAWLRIMSLVIGCAVGIATFISIIRNQKRQGRLPRAAVPQNQNGNSATSPKSK